MAESQDIKVGKAGQSFDLDREDFEKRVNAWRSNPTSGHLGDVLAFMVDKNFESDVSKVMQEALSRQSEISSVQRFLIADASESISNENHFENYSSEIFNPFVRQRVQESRRLLRIFPKNPLLLLDFAQLKLSSGDFFAADRLVRSARSLSPDHRIILRTQARLLAHAGKHDEAHALIARHRRTASDPWLMATEIALAQASGLPPIFAKAGSRFAKDKSIQPRHVSELAGALGGLELFNGSVKRARDLFRTALIQPNDNVVAQAITDQKFLSIAVDIDGRWMGDRSEARSLLAWNKLDADAAFSNGMIWHEEEPFSSRPLQFLGSLLAATGRYKEAAAISARGLIADGKNAGLMANSAYALASLGELDKAEKLARRAAVLSPQKFMLQTTATLGLIDMKRGFIESADAKYTEALSGFSTLNQREFYAICYAYYARSAYDCEHPDATQISAAALDAYRRSPSTDAALVLKKLGQDFSADEDNSRTPMLRTHQWEFDARKNEMVKMSRLVAPDEPLIKFIN